MGQKEKESQGNRNSPGDPARNARTEGSVDRPELAEARVAGLEGTPAGRSAEAADPAKVARTAEDASDAVWDPKPPSTRDRLVEAARQLFLVKGYEATGIAEILREAGVNSGSLYYFFKTKEELLLAVLELYVEMLHPVVMDPVFAHVGDPIERVFAVLQGYRQMLIITSCRQGCPIGNLALEMSEKSEAAREKIALNFRNWRKAIEGCLRDAAARFPPGTDFESMSVFILTVMEGAVMQARAHRSLEPFDASVNALREYVDRMMVK